MPLRPVTKTLNLPVETAADVAKVWERLLGLAKLESPSKRRDERRDLEDHLLYIGAVCPERFRPLQETAALVGDEHLEDVDLRFEVWRYLLAGAPDAAVVHLEARLRAQPADGVRAKLLAAIGTPAALAAIGRLAKDPALCDAFEALGVAIRRPRPARLRGALEAIGLATPEPSPPVRLRFADARFAVKVTRGPLAGPHPVGLPVGDVILADPRRLVVWHYVTLTLAGLPGLERLPFERLHLVSPKLENCWTLSCEVDPATSRYEVLRLIDDEANEDPDGLFAEEMAGRTRVPDAAYGSGMAELIPYGPELVYTNGHIHSTPDVVGTVGGLPLEIVDIPKCTRCGVVMFHVATVTMRVRTYGDGFRSLFVCETCRIAANVASSWN